MPLSPAMRRVLMFVAADRAKEHLVSGIAAACNLGRSPANRTLKSLERRGLVVENTLGWTSSKAGEELASEIRAALAETKTPARGGRFRMRVKVDSVSVRIQPGSKRSPKKPSARR
jgi:hypothetical protein